MKHEAIVAEAMKAGINAKHNMLVIRKHPEKILSGKTKKAEQYLNMMIRFAEAEKKNARWPDRTSLRNRLKILLLSIVTFDTPKRKKVKYGE